MPAPRKLDSERTSLEDLADEVQFTKLVVRNTPEAKALVAGADKLHADAEALLGKERLLYTALLDAEVKVAIANRGLDAWVLGFRSQRSSPVRTVAAALTTAAVGAARSLGALGRP